MAFLVTTLATELSSSRAHERSPECTPALEGRLVGASSGVLLRVPFSGTLNRRTPDARTEPAADASIGIASAPCPRGKPRSLPLDGAGHFQEAFTLTTDTHLFCRAGSVVTERRVMPIRLRIASPGCQSIEVELHDDAGPYALELECTPDASHEASTSEAQTAPSPTGAAVTLSTGLLAVNSVAVTLPVEVARLEQTLGPPSGVDRAAGDRYSNDVYEWEASGIFGFAHPGSAVIHALGFILAPDRNDRHWCEPGTVRLTINGVDITRASQKRQIRRAGFRGDLELHYEGLYASLLAIGEPPDYYQLEVGTE